MIRWLWPPVVMSVTGVAGWIWVDSARPLAVVLAVVVFASCVLLYIQLRASTPDD